jgi:O-antigen/teichoic acid export membrane protein
LYPLTAFYGGKNKIINNIKGSLIALIVIVSGNILLVPKFGIAGAAVVSSLGYISYYVYVSIILKHEFGLAVSDFLILKKTDIGLLRIFFNKDFSAGEKE